MQRVLFPPTKSRRCSSPTRGARSPDSPWRGDGRAYESILSQMLPHTGVGGIAITDEVELQIALR